MIQIVLGLTVMISVMFGSTSVLSAPAQPPIVLGTWQGMYEIEANDVLHQNHMFMEVFYQKSQNGWKTQGKMRWHVPTSDQSETEAMLSEAFTTFDATIEQDLRTMRITAAHIGNDILANLQTSETLVIPMPATADLPAFSVTLTRIDTHYTPNERGLLGFDISHHSGSVDWQMMSDAGYQFVYIKASEGIDNPDANFHHNWSGARDVGFARGAYHFYVTEDDPVQQAELLLSQLGGDLGELPPAVDLELLGKNTDKTSMSASLRLFLTTLESRTGVKPVIYTSSSFWDRYYDAEFTDYPLWMAEYGVQMPKVPFGWENWLIWQRQKNVTVQGVEKNIDVNLLHPSVSLKEITRHAH